MRGIVPVPAAELARFLRTETVGGTVLLASAAASLLAAALLAVRGRAHSAPGTGLQLPCEGP